MLSTISGLHIDRGSSVKVTHWFEYSLFYRALLQKRLILLRSPLYRSRKLCKSDSLVCMQVDYSLFYRALLQNIGSFMWLIFVTVSQTHWFACKLSNMPKFECMWPPISDSKLQFSGCHTNSSCAHEDVTWLIRHRHEYVTWCFFATDVKMGRDSKIPQITPTRHVHIWGGYGP